MVVACTVAVPAAFVACCSTAAVAAVVATVAALDREPRPVAKFAVKGSRGLLYPRASLVAAAAAAVAEAVAAVVAVAAPVACIGLVGRTQIAVVSG